MSGPEHTSLSPSYRSPHIPIPAHVYPQTQPKLFVSEALFSRQLAPQPSFHQINIAPEIAGISGIFEGPGGKEASGRTRVLSVTPRR